ncbi:hypothetical protein LIER_31510 [Lithospermum erythrorhizon]|uniref:RNase H type-1 domain-containing protein n=1 Tax=Lithospermum erythrorhizon TaxID=34254 RepID=A0AAV3RS79_LITER
MTWLWWKNRCGIVFGKRQQPLEDIVRKGMQLAKDYAEANAHPPSGSRTGDNSAAEVPITGWQPPRNGRYKLNSDAAFYKESSRGSIGAIVRDKEGVFMGALFRSLPFVSQVLVVEAMALREGIGAIMR